MKSAALVFVFLLYINSFYVLGQTDTVLVYDVASKTIQKIPPVAFDSSITFGQTSFSTGSLGNTVNLSLTPPTLNLFSGSNFSNVARAELFFNLTDYPVRTAIRMFRYSNDTLGGCCSGIMIGKNLVLTAAHCILNNSLGVWRGDSVLIAPVYNNGIFQPGLQHSIVNKYYVFNSFYNGGFQEDFALLELKQAIGEQIGWVGMAYHKDTSFYSNHVFHKFSYPAIVDPFDTTKVYNGDTLYYNYGNINNLGNDLGIYSSEAIGIPGQSGSSFLYTDNSNYYTVGTMSYSTGYRHMRISNTVFYQLKNIVDNYATSVPDNSNFNQFLSIYPNPANFSIKIETNLNKTGKYNLILFNIVGKKVFSKSIEHTVAFNLDLSAFDNGIYYITLQNNKERLVQKLVIQH